MTAMTMPESGSRVPRSQSRRRYIMVGESREHPGEPWIIQRSDSTEVMFKARQRRIDKHGWSHAYVIFDTATQEVVR